MRREADDPLPAVNSATYKDCDLRLAGGGAGSLGTAVTPDGTVLHVRTSGNVLSVIEQL